MVETLFQFINHQSYESSGAKRIFESPWDQSSLAEYKEAEDLDIIQAIQAGRKFLIKPMAWPKEDRLRVLNSFRRIIQENANQWAESEAQYQGLAVTFVLENGIQHTLEIIDRSIQDLEKNIPGRILAPTGLVAALTPWNLCFRVAMETLVPALAAGNAVIIKVSSKSPGTALLLQKLVTAAEVPAGAVSILLGPGERVGLLLASHPAVRAVSFTGQATNANILLKQLPPQYKKLKIRGATKNAAIVLPGYKDDDFNSLMESFLLGQGRMGWGMSRLLTLESELPALKDKIQTYLSNLKLSKSTKDQGPWRPLSDINLQFRLVQKAQDEHSKLMFEADSQLPQFLLDLPNCSDLQQEELAAPVFPIIATKYNHEIAKWANNTPFGSLAVIWGDAEKALKLCDKLEFSHIWINHWMRKQDFSPWGVKQSAFGISDDLPTGSFYSDQKLTL